MSGPAAPPGSARVSCDCGIRFTPGGFGGSRDRIGGTGAGPAPRGPGSPHSAPLFQSRMRWGCVSCPPPAPGARGAPGAPGPAPLPARRGSAGPGASASSGSPLPPASASRGGGRRSHCFSLNFMASVHYYTVRIFIWTAKLKTDFCQNCRYHKKPEAPGARRSPRCGGGPAPGAGGCPGVGRDVGHGEGCGGQDGGGCPRFCAVGSSGRRPRGGSGGPGGPRSRGRGGQGWHRSPPPRGLQSRPLPRPVCQAPSQRS